ncbi:MAG: hypothetical protein GX321_03165 [Clostridiales bacterium]|nr:hypothetical protein [Clostridiales bacterium]
MKKTSLFIVILISIFLAISCNSGTNNSDDSYVPSDDDFFQYDIKDGSCSYADTGFSASCTTNSSRFL